MTVVADYVAPAPIEVASQEAVDALISNIKYSAKTEQDLLEMFQLATEVGNIFEVAGEIDAPARARQQRRAGHERPPLQQTAYHITEARHPRRQEGHKKCIIARR